MVRIERISGRLSLLTLALVVGAATIAAAPGCKKKRPKEKRIDAILKSEPNLRARNLRSQMAALTKQGKYKEASAKVALLQKAVADILAAMDQLHHKKTAVPDFAVIRYVESLRDLGRTLRGFDRIYSGSNPAKLKKEMLEGLISQLQQRIK